jgi:phospholipid transport system substrate-binding protein
MRFDQSSATASAFAGAVEHRALGSRPLGRRALGQAVLATALLAALPCRPARAAGDAAAFMKDVGDRVLRLLNDQQTPETQRRAEFDKLAIQAFDVPRIAQFVLGRYWTTASDQERQQFVQTFQTYMVSVYWSRFHDYAGVDFKVTGERPSGNQVDVTTEVGRSSGQPPAKVDWTIAQDGGSFKIRDASLEGVSQALTYRQEFSSVIERNGGRVSALIDQLRQKANG